MGRDQVFRLGVDYFLVCICIAFNIDSFHGLPKNAISNGRGGRRQLQLSEADRSASQLARFN